MFKNLYPVFRSVIKLANEYEKLHNEAYGGRGFSVGEFHRREKTPIEIEAD
jgi:hypothetical protein